MIRDTEAGGIRILSESFPIFHSVALGIVFRQGSRDESAAEQGLTHLTEHMLFKGTRTRSARQLAHAIESIGGMINGFTNKEMTGIYVRFLAEHFDLVEGVVLDLLNESQFAAQELAKEREVIYEEIKSAHEDPEEEAAEMLFKAAYGDHPLGFPVSGEPETVGRVSDSRLREFYADRYTRERTFVAAVGEIDHPRLESQLGARLGFKSGPDRRPREKPSLQPSGLKLHERREISQVFVCLARPAISYADERRHALTLASSVLGGSSSSRLFQRLREDEGLVYSVSSFAELYSDTGLFGVFFATDRKKLDKAMAVVREEWDRLVRDNLSAEEMTLARNYTKGTMTLSLESTTGRLMRMVSSRMMLGRVVPVEEKMAKLDALTRDDVAEVFHTIGKLDDCYVSAVGPITEAELRKLL